MKVTYIVSDIDKALAFEWIASGLNKKKIDLEFILLTRKQTILHSYLKSNNIKVKEIRFKPGFGLIIPFFRIWWYLMITRPDIIHTHLRYGSLLGITAGYLAGIKRRIHTRHHSTFHKIYHPHAVRQDKFVSRLSTQVVAISKVVADTLIIDEETPREKVVIIHHGFDLNLFQNVKPDEVENLRRKYLKSGSAPVIGIVSRYIKWKGIEYGITAFSKLLKSYPNAHLILANAVGPDADYMKEHLKILPEGSYTEIKFENHIAALYQLFDVFVHTPIDSHFEAFGQTYVEALTAGIPSVFTISGIANEFIKDGENAVVVPYKDSKSICRAMEKIIGNQHFKEHLIVMGKSSVQQFGLGYFIGNLERLYEI